MLLNISTFQYAALRFGARICAVLSVTAAVLWEHTYFTSLSFSFLICRMGQKLLHGYKFIIILPALIAQFVVHRVHLIGEILVK